jgi:hypothetical protein
MTRRGSQSEACFAYLLRLALRTLRVRFFDACPRSRKQKSLLLNHPSRQKNNPQSTSIRRGTNPLKRPIISSLELNVESQLTHYNALKKKMTTTY